MESTTTTQRLLCFCLNYSSFLYQGYFIHSKKSKYFLGVTVLGSFVDCPFHFYQPLIILKEVNYPLPFNIYSQNKVGKWNTQLLVSLRLTIISLFIFQKQAKYFPCSHNKLQVGFILLHPIIIVLFLQ